MTKKDHTIPLQHIRSDELANAGAQIHCPFMPPQAFDIKGYICIFILMVMTFLFPARQSFAESASAQPNTSVVLWYRNYDSPAIYAVLDLALKKTPEYGPYTIVRSKDMNQGRVLRELQNNNTSVVQLANVATSPNGKTTCLPFPSPSTPACLAIVFA